YAVIPMTGRIRWLRFSPIIAVLALAACGGSGGTKTVTVTETVTTTTPTQTTPTEKTNLRVYFLSHGKVQPVAREVPKTQAVASPAFTALPDGPSSPEAAIGLTTSMPRIERFELTLVNGVLTLTTRPLSGAGLAQTVYTLTQFPGRDDVVVNGKRYARTDFEDFTPAILVEHPLPFTIVSSPLRMAG